MTKSKEASSAKKSKKEAPSWISEGDDEDYENDEAPDTVSFNQGREEALESISSALRDLQRTKLEAKERRRKRDKLLKEQKQKKKVSLSNARLPANLLSKLGQQQDTSLELREKSQDTEQPQTESLSADREIEEEEDGESDEDEFDAGSEEDLGEMKHPSNIHVIQSSKIVHPPPHDAALQFLKNQMYGSRIPRETMAKNISRRMKRFGKPGVDFCQKKPQGIKKKKKK